jgi:glycosyltransferase involved in cell wall biosynthesis
MKVEVFVIAWNEAETIALTIKHYQKFCDKITLYDNFSDDNTREIAMSMGCEVKLFGVKGSLDDREYTKLKNNCWKGSDADWVIVVDADEILDPGFRHSMTFTDGELSESKFITVLEQEKSKGATIIKTYGWQVMSHEMPKEDWLEIKTGYHYENYSKLCCFNPKEIKEIGYVHGCHVAKPTGNVVFSTEILPLFHYRNVGGPDRLIKRHALYRARMSEWNTRWNAGGHYLIDDNKRRKEWETQYAGSAEFRLLGGE